MGMIDEIEGIVRRQMVLFFVIDTSGSMAGTKIGSVNTAISEVLPELKDIGGSDVELKIACLQFSSGCQWMHPSPIAVEDFRWNNVAASGVTDLGAACRELAGKMSKDKFLSAPSASVAPAIFLMSDGEPTDDYEGGLAVLLQNRWFKNAIKAAIAIGNDANQDALTKFTGSSEAVLTVHTPEALKKMIRFVTVTSSTIGSKSQPIAEGKIESKQNSLIDAIRDNKDEFKQSEADLNNQSTSGNDW
jgi:uncharacterized protein YegL